MGGFALLVRYLSWWSAGALCIAAFLFNRFFLIKITGKRLMREEDKKRGYPAGIYFYPLILLALFVLFPKHPQIVCAAWGLMAFGDGGAALFGTLTGYLSLPWNPDKSWEGLIAFLLMGTSGSAFLFWWVNRGHGKPVSVLRITAICGIAALICAFIETIPSGINDNLSVPFLGALTVYSLLKINLSAMTKFPPNSCLPAFIVNILAAGTAFLFGTVGLSGALSGFFIGVFIYIFAGWKGYTVIILFFVLASGATKLGYSRKEKAGLAQEEEGKRSWQNALANCGAGIFIAPLIAFTPGALALKFSAAYTAVFATASFDTVSSEIGQLWGKTTYLVPSFRRVPRGTEGAVSVEGTLAGLGSAVVIAGAGFFTGMFGYTGTLFVIAGAFIGTTFESITASGTEDPEEINNEFLNFLNTVVGAFSTFLLMNIWELL